MIKYLFILINSISLFIYSLFSGDGGITVTNNIPKNLQPGKEVAIEIKVSKGNQSGFAKLQLELPAGLSVKEIDNKGANYSYVDGIAKWVWASLPAENDLIVKVTLIADAAATGLKTISGKYSFVENNAKQVIEMAPAEIIIGEEKTDVAINTNTTVSTPTTQNTNTTVAVTPTVEAPTTPTVQQSNNGGEPAGNITVQRTITKGNFEGDYVVSLKVLKGSTKGFARYSDDLPKGLTAKSIKTEGASFSVSDGKVKFVWVAVPGKEELDLSYTISGVKNQVALNGEYSYLEQNQSKKFLLPVENLLAEQSTANNTNTIVPQPTVAAITPTIEPPSNTKTVAPETKTTEPVVTTPTVAENPTVTNTADNNNKPTETLSKNEGNVNFMVQIGAFTNSAVQASTLSRKFNISEKINSEMQGGFSKFMVGTHPEYKSARDHREKIKNGNGVNSAFVVAYNTGKRITVQEALMISSQKWYK
jgi:cell division septation protein DedD